MDSFAPANVATSASANKGGTKSTEFDPWTSLAKCNDLSAAGRANS